jgi:hypothetical protein
MSIAAKQPARPGKRICRSETILAAKLVDWLALCNRLAAQLDQVPHLQELFTRFQALLAPAQALRDHLASLREETQNALGQRDELMAECDELFSRLRLGLEAIHGPRSPRLHEFGLKPQAKPGRKKAAVAPDPESPEVTE